MFHRSSPPETNLFEQMAITSVVRLGGMIMVSMGTRLFNDGAFFNRRRRRIHRESGRLAFRMIEQNQDVPLEEILEAVLAHHKLVDLKLGSLMELRVSMQPEMVADLAVGQLVRRHAHDALVGFQGSKALWSLGFGRRDMPRYGFIGQATARIRILYGEPSLPLFQETIEKQLEAARAQLALLPEWTEGFNRFVDWQAPQALQLLHFEMQQWRDDLRPRPCTCDTDQCLEHRGPHRRVRS